MKTTYRDTKFHLSTLDLFTKMFQPIGTYKKQNTLSISKITFQNVDFTYPIMQEYEREYLEIVEKYF